MMTTKDMRSGLRKAPAKETSGVLCRNKRLQESFSRGGFTLIEVLVVMAILGSLAAILVPIINSGRRMAKIAATRNLLAQIETAISQFERQWGYYPPDKIPPGAPTKKFTAPPTVWSGFPGTAESAEALYYCLCNLYVTPYSPYLELQAERESTDNNGNGIPEIIDRFGRSFVYRRKAFPADATLPAVFPGVASLATYDDGADPFRNKEAYDLWSRGPGTTVADTAEAQWITNWK
ncbi:MAG: type II secretion system protein [Planctomycetes bacterium]|nr:type II secretion system protein [Planctomycetota bacterium]